MYVDIAESTPSEAWRFCAGEKDPAPVEQGLTRHSYRVLRVIVIDFPNMNAAWPPYVYQA
jgi:hypothetical protein